MPRRLLVAPILLATASALHVSGCIGSCFGGATWISLRRGRKRLRDVQVGDVIQSFDVASGQLALRPVLRVFRHGRRPVGQLLSAAGVGPHEVTSNHPIFVEPTGVFEAAGELDGAHRQRRGLYWDDHDLRSIQLEPYRAAPDAPWLEVYNLSVAGTETYFADGLLVHNKTFDDCWDDSCYEPNGGTAGAGAGTGGLVLGDDFVGSAGGTLANGGEGGAAGSAGAAGEGGVAGEAGGKP